jgi:hypothetical protein
MIDRELLRDAVNALIASPRAHEMFEALTVLLPIATNNFPVKLSGDAAVLNPLIALKKSNPTGYDGVIELVEKRRAEAGFDRLTKDKASDEYDKTEYMRMFMDQKRQRERRAAAIENMLRPEREKLIGTARLEFMRRQSAAWKEQRDRFLEAARGPHGVKLEKEKMQETLARFWSAVDSDLDERETRARAEAVKPESQRRRPDASLEALLQALEFDPYKS